jgi:hypothetical protein
MAARSETPPPIRDGTAFRIINHMVEREARRVPSGWQARVKPPGTPDWEATAAAWLLDLLPEYRQYPTMRRHPIVLAFIARHVLDGAVEGASRKH